MTNQDRASPGQPHPGAGRQSPDVVIIGGGVIGLAIAWRSAQRGLRVTVCDPAPGTGASHAAAGMLTPVSEAAYAERELFGLAQRSLDSYAAFTTELTELTGEPTGFRADGTLQVAYDHDDLGLLDELAVLQESFGAVSQRLTARECRAAEPMLDPAVRGGLLATGDASVDPRRLTTALLAAVQAAGVTVVPQAAASVTVTGTPGSARAGGVVLADGTRLAAGQVVLAAGWSSALIGGLPDGTVPPVRPVKGQILRLRSTPATQRAGLRPGLIGRTIRGIVRGSSVYLVPRDSGELVIGATQEELGADTLVTAGGVWELLRDARTLVPGITELELAEAVAGLRPGTPDNAPVLGPARLPGLMLATGHFRSGVLLAPVTADIMAEILDGERLPDLARPFLIERFTRDSQEPGRPPARSAGPDPSRATPSGGLADAGQFPEAAGPAAEPPDPGPAAGPPGGPADERDPNGPREDAMTVIINGTRHELADGSSLAAAVALLTSAQAGVAAAVNGAVVRRPDWNLAGLADGDTVEVITAVQGG